MQSAEDRLGADGVRVSAAMMQTGPGQAAGGETRERICIRQSATFDGFGRPYIVPTSRPFSMSIGAYENWPGWVIGPLD